MTVEPYNFLGQPRLEFPSATMEPEHQYFNGVIVLAGPAFFLG